MGLGFQLAEKLSGSYYRLDEPVRDHAMRVALQLGVNGLGRFLKERRIEARGTIFAEGLAARDPGGVPLSGTLTMNLFDQKRIPYDLEFEGDDGKEYRLRGQREFFMFDAIDSLTILPASIYLKASDDQADWEIGRAILRFDLKTEVAPLLKSFRPKFRISKFASGID